MYQYFTFLLIFIYFLNPLDSYPQNQNQEKLSPIHEAIEEINPELDKISERLNHLKIELLKTSLQTQIDVQKISINSSESLLDAINKLYSESSVKTNETNGCFLNLNDKIEKMLFVANSKTNQNVQEGVTKINNFTENIKSLVSKADDIDKNINKIIGYCIRQNNLIWQKERLKNCLLNETKLINEVIDKLYQEKQCFIGNVSEDNGSHIMKWFAKVEAEFHDCIYNLTALQPLAASSLGTETNVTQTQNLELIEKIQNLKELLQQLVKPKQGLTDKVNSTSSKADSSPAAKDKFIMFISL